MNTDQQTYTSFRDKWEQNRQLAFSETLREGSDIFNWILGRNGFSSVPQFKEWLQNRNRILDAGCGNGRVTALLHEFSPPSSQIFGVDLTASHVAAENLKDLQRVEVKEFDLLGDLTPLGEFDLIYCQEVLHHTSNPRQAFLNLCSRLVDCGEIAIYVYKVKAPLREYADDVIRDEISNLSYEQSLESMTQITLLGKALSELDIKVSVPDIEILKIQSGEYDIQRFLYHFFLKCFWNPSLSFEENVAINYDWYHPQLCSRHEVSEVREWFESANVRIIHECVDHYGITLRGVKE